jgi:flagellar basal-body rod protein FlgB
MDFSKIALFSMMKTKMGYLSQRQDVLAQNIANIDTPGYTPKDVRKPEFENMALAEANRLSMRMTSSGHMNAGTSTEEEGKLATLKNRKTYEMNPTKNRVVVEEQMMKSAETKMEYEVTTNLYKKVANMFKTATGNQS